MAGIKQIYRTPDSFRFPIWDVAISYPVNSVVANYDSDTPRWRHYISLVQTTPGSLDSDIKFDEWIEMSFDSDTIYNIAVKASIASSATLLAYLQPRLDSELSANQDSDFTVLSDNLKLKIDSDVDLKIAVFEANESDKRTTFETRVLAEVSDIDSDNKSGHDSDIQQMKIKVDDQDSDIAVIKLFTNAGTVLTVDFDSEIARQDARYADLSKFAVNNQIEIFKLQGRTTDNDSDITTMQNKIAGFEFIVDQDSDVSDLRQKIIDGDSDTKALIDAVMDSEYRARINGDSDLRAFLIKKIDSDIADIKYSQDSDYAYIKEALDDVYEQYIRISTGDYSGTGGGADSEWIQANNFNKISVSGKSDVIASANGTLTLVAGDGVGIETDAVAKSVTISSTVNQGLDFGTFNNPAGFTLDMQTF